MTQKADSFDRGSSDDRWSQSPGAEAQRDEIQRKLEAWTLAHFRSADYPKCPACQGNQWTWQANVQITPVGRRIVFRICNACKYAMRFDADTIGL